MTGLRVTGLAILALACFASPNFGQTQTQLIVYPAKGQTPELQKKDESECYTWAKGQTGFDPAAPPTVAQAPPPSTAPQGQVLRGAARGAVLGEIVSDDAGTGAAAGAAIGAMRRQDQKRAQQQQAAAAQQQQQQAIAQKASDYNRAYAACLEARSYTVK